MANLYDIDNRLKMLEDYQMDIETGEILSDEEFNKLFDEVEMALSEKIENTICFVKNLRADVDSFKEEEKRLAQRRKTKENLANRLLNRIDEYIRSTCTNEDGVLDFDRLHKYKMETPKVKISYRGGQEINVIYDKPIPKEFTIIKKEEVIDKRALNDYAKKMLKEQNKLREEKELAPLEELSLGFVEIKRKENIGIK